MAFRTTKDALGQNGDGSNELFHFETSNPSGVSQVTDSAGAFLLNTLEVTNDGRMYFQSNSDLDGSNPGARTRLWELDATSGQIKDVLGDLGVSYDAPFFEVSNDGTKITLISRDILTSEAPNNNQYKVYSIDLLYGEIQLQTTLQQAGIGGTIELASDGSSLLFSSVGDYAGQNGDGSMEIFSFDLRRDASSIDIEVGEGTAGGILTEIAALGSALKGLGNTLITTQDSAAAALDTVQLNIQLVSQAQGIIGAGLSRLETAGAVLSVRTEQSLLAESRIRDADIAEESAKLVRANVLQQTAAAVLAQANTLPELAVQLLRG